MKEAPNEDPLRAQLVRLLDWEEGHVGFDKAVDGLSPQQRGVCLPGFEHTPWQLLEHLRLAQKDLLDFCANPRYVHALKWPDDYWPQNALPETQADWENSIKTINENLDEFIELLKKSENIYALLGHGTGQTLLREAMLIADHNSYHTGEIIVLRRLLGNWK